MTGPSGSGKTTLANQLTGGGHPHVQELDAHPDGLPNAAHGEWLTWRAQELLHAAVLDQDVDEHRVVTGIVMPFDLIDTPVWDRAVEASVTVRFVLLDRPWERVEAGMTDRLSAEGWDSEDITEQLLINRRQVRRMRRQIDVLFPEYGCRVVEGKLDVAADLVAPDATSVLRSRPASNWMRNW